MRRASGHPLEYAPAPTRRSRWLRRLTAATIAALTAIIVARITPVAWQHYVLLRLQKQCMTYSAPADQIVLRLKSGNVTPPPTPWNAFYATLSGTGLYTRGTLFLHERTSPGGHRRLVAVDAGQVSISSDLDLLGATARIIVPGTPFSRPREIVDKLGFTASFRGLVPQNEPPPFDVFAGQLDPTNESHFTIKVVTGTLETIIDGWLQDDDTVLLEPRPPTPIPMTQPQVSN